MWGNEKRVQFSWTRIRNYRRYYWQNSFCGADNEVNVVSSG